MARPARALCIVAALVLAPFATRAQSAPRPSAYIPLDDPSMPAIDALVARGAFRQLSALERPYRARDVAAALGQLVKQSGEFTEWDPSRHPQRWLAVVRDAVRRHDPAALDSADSSALRFSAAVVPFATAQSTGRRELLAADTAKGGVYPGADVRVSLEAPAFVAVTRVRVDRALKADPEFAGKSDRVVAGRLEDAYLAARWRWAALDVGRVARSWGPAPLAGLQLGYYADSYDHVQLVLGTDRLHLATLAARLDDMRLPADTVAQRYFAIHRVAGRWRGLELAASEAVVYGGPARGFDLGLSNPLGLYDLAQYDEHKSLNVSYAFDLALRTAARGLWAAQLLVDDFQIDNCDSNCKEPPSLALTVSAEGVPVPLGAGSAFFASYTRVGNLVYRTPTAWERYASLGLGLGRGQSDYDEVRAGLELAPPLGGPLRVYGALRRKGEGDYRLPFPTRAEYPGTPEILAGTVERVTRVGAQWSAAGAVAVLADVGYQWTSNAGHVAGASRSGVEGRVKISLTRPLRIARTIADQ